MAHGPPLSWHNGRFVVAVMLLPLLAVATVSAMESFVRAQASAQAPEASPAMRLGFGPQTYALALERADQDVLLGRERVAFAQGEWLRRESHALGLLRRAQLTGEFPDIVAALAETRNAMALAPDGGGPLLTWATIAMSTHVLSEAETALAMLDNVAVPPSAAEFSEIAALRGDLAFYRGDMRAAAIAYAKADNLARSPGTAIRIARLAKARGDQETARAWFMISLRGTEPPTPQLAALVQLQLGGLELARGEYAAARSRFVAANLVFPGQWVAQAHLAQAKALDGDLTGAILEMRALAERTNQPDVMDALALLLRADGRAAESSAWAERSGALWAARLQILPEAALGHAIEHELAFGEPERAVALARRNLAARPFGEAHFLLAQALMQTGDFAGALGEVRDARKKGWRSASLFALESNLLSLTGKTREAEHSRKEALMHNPRIFDGEMSLIWFSHG